MATLSRRLGGPGLTPRTSARALAEAEWLYVCQPLSYATDASSVGSISTVIYPRPQQLAFPLTVTVPQNTSDIFVNSKNSSVDLPFGSPAP